MREDHLVSWAWWVVRLGWGVKKAGKWYSRGKRNDDDDGSGGWEGDADVDVMVRRDEMG